MASSFEKSVKGATKVKLAAPKSKYVEHILIATHAGEAGIAEVFRALNHRLKDQTWTIVFKALIIVHLMIREGEKDVTLRYLRKNPRVLAVSNYTDAQEQGRNIRHYSQYLHERARAYGDVRTDYVRHGEGRLRKLSIEKGLLREVECVQTQIRSLLKCAFLEDDVDNEISLTAFRLLVMDLLVFFHVVNEGVINVLEHYFEMSRYDAERALAIYKTFTKQTADVVEYLQQARRLETSTRLQIPNLKHAPTSLTSSLEEYLHDPDFDVNRRQYLAQQETKKGGGKISSAPTKTAVSVAESETKGSGNDQNTAPAAQITEPAPTQPKVAPDLIDFFETLETEQTSIFPNAATQSAQPVPILQPQAQFSQPQPNFIPQTFNQPMQPFPTQVADFGSYPAYSTNNYGQPGQPPSISTSMVQNSPAQPIQSDFTGQGFGGYTSQDQISISVPPIPSAPSSFQLSSGLQQPFQAPILQSQFQLAATQQNFQPQPQANMLQSPPSLSIPQAQDTNPFRQSMMATGSSQSLNPFPASPPPPKSTNPFARAAPNQPANNVASSPISGYPTPNSATSQSSPFSTQPTIGSNPLRSPSTSTNPFTRNITGPQTTPAPSIPSTTGGSGNNLSIPSVGTNPFRQSMMQSQQLDGQPTPSIPAWENIPTIPVFPRSTGSSSNGTQQQQQPW